MGAWNSSALSFFVSCFLCNFSFFDATNRTPFCQPPRGWERHRGGEAAGERASAKLWATTVFRSNVARRPLQERANGSAGADGAQNFARVPGGSRRPKYSAFRGPLAGISWYSCGVAEGLRSVRELRLSRRLVSSR